MKLSYSNYTVNLRNYIFLLKKQVILLCLKGKLTEG